MYQCKSPLKGVGSASGVVHYAGKFSGTLSVNSAQKNLTHVRYLFGYDRLEDKAMVPLMNEIYRAYWNKLHNFFVPCMKLKKRKRVGSRIKKYYDEPKTPYERIMEMKNVPKWVKGRLKEQKEAYNPFTLREMLDKRMEEFQTLLRHQRIRQKFQQKDVA